MSKYTPGPWEYIGGLHGNAIGWFVKVSSNRIISVEGRTGNEATANAHLVAAAPELLEALESIENHWSSGNFSRKPELWKKMKTAIAKARGDV
jgi:hypothetical protein